MAWRTLVTKSAVTRIGNGTYQITFHFTNDDGRTVDTTDSGFLTDADVQRYCTNKLRDLTNKDAVIANGDVLIKF